MPPPLAATQPAATGPALAPRTRTDVARVKKIDRQLAAALRLVKNTEALAAILKDEP